MIGAILLAMSWLLLRWEGKSISELGFNRPRRRLTEFAMGFSIAAVFCVAQQVLIAGFSGFHWVVNQEMTLPVLLDSLRWNVNSVLFEELIFRGYLLYKAIQWLGPHRACLLSAASFGVYHWFSYGLLGNWIAMIYVFFLTGTFGLMLAISFQRTQSVIAPIALHLGWNVVSIVVFSRGPIGPQLLIPSTTEPAMVSGVEQIVINLLIPLSLPALVIWLMTRKPVNNPARKDQAAYPCEEVPK